MPVALLRRRARGISSAVFSGERATPGAAARLLHKSRSKYSISPKIRNALRM